uniref:t-SNARE coiled-coil homology domain-containing protein n=1 Tax=Gouania willdenowi TaxID=441366 RepID=A0A8C5GYL3_GOUWI
MCVILVILKKWPVDEKSISPSVMERIQRNQHSYLTGRFSDVMRDYHQAQVSFRDKCKAQIQRKLEIVDKTISNEEMEEMLHCDDLTLFISDAHISKRALTEIESRHRDIICLESSIKELQEVFADTAMLLETQGDLINNIEKNVSKAAEYVEVSRAETNKAVQYKKHWVVCVNQRQHSGKRTPYII